MDKNLFFYELEGRGYTFQNKNWDEAKHGFEDDMLNMAWEMWSSGQAAKAQVPEGFDFGLSHDTKINDPKELLFRCLRNMKFKKGFRANQNWVHVKHMCCLGSTTAKMLCRFFGVDPDGIKFEVIEAQEQSND